MARNILITRRDWRQGERVVLLRGSAWALRLYSRQENDRKKLSCWAGRGRYAWFPEPPQKKGGD